MALQMPAYLNRTMNRKHTLELLAELGTPCLEIVFRFLSNSSAFIASQLRVHQQEALS